LHDVPLPTRLVHIPRNPDKQLRLRVSKGLTGQYVALSYCWGRGEVFKTTSAEYGARLDGFEAGMLPQTIQDAVSIARRFGFEYIWIDALCIIQGDVEDWAHESSRMSRVYGNASLTLCADLARSSDDGILRPRKTLYSHNFGPSQEHCLQTRAHLRNAMGWDQVPYEPLGQRGWALQE
jgi:Heterokaryon incompatibility protein (HET)